MTLSINDKVLDALEVIQQECMRHKDCEGCPMVSAEIDKCILEDAPKGWTLKPRIVLD